MSVDSSDLLGEVSFDSGQLLLFVNMSNLSVRVVTVSGQISDLGNRKLI